MCLSIPSKVVEIDAKNGSVVVETMGVQREARLDLMEENSINVGDYVLLHIGYVMNKIDEEAALASLEAYQEVLKLLDNEALE